VLLFRTCPRSAHPADRTSAPNRSSRDLAKQRQRRLPRSHIDQFGWHRSRASMSTARTELFVAPILRGQVSKRRIPELERQPKTARECSRLFVRSLLAPGRLQSRTGAGDAAPAHRHLCRGTTSSCNLNGGGERLRPRRDGSPGGTDSQGAAHRVRCVRPAEPPFRLSPAWQLRHQT